MPLIFLPSKRTSYEIHTCEGRWISKSSRCFLVWISQLQEFRPQFGVLKSGVEKIKSILIRFVFAVCCIGLKIHQPRCGLEELLGPQHFLADDAILFYKRCAFNFLIAWVRFLRTFFGHKSRYRLQKTLGNHCLIIDFLGALKSSNPNPVLCLHVTLHAHPFEKAQQQHPEEEEDEEEEEEEE